MRRIIGILFVLMLAASVGATGGYGGLYVDNRVPGMDLLRAAENATLPEYITDAFRSDSGYSLNNAIVVAGNDAPDAIKAIADYVCDGVDDEVQMSAAFSDFRANGRKGSVRAVGTIVLNNPPLYLPSNILLEGDGINNTVFLNKSTTNQPTFVYDNSYYDTAGPGYFITLSRFSLRATETNTSAHVFTGFTLDFHVIDVFFEGGGSGANRKMAKGLVAFNSWGTNIDRSLVEWHTGDGWTFNSLGYIFTGTYSGDDTPRVGDIVTQDGTGATGYVTYIDNSDNYDYEWGNIYSSGDDSGDPDELAIYPTTGVFNNSGAISVIGKDVTFTPDSKGAFRNSVGPKITQCKIQECGGDALVLGTVDGAIVTACEFTCETGSSGIEFRGADRCIIASCRFLSMKADADSYIDFAAPYLSGSVANKVDGCVFVINGTAVGAVEIERGNEYGINSSQVISNNMVLLAGVSAADCTLFTDAGDRYNRVGYNNISNNAIYDTGNYLDWSGYHDSIPVNDGTECFYSSLGASGTYDNSAFTAPREHELPKARFGQTMAFRIKNTNKWELYPYDQSVTGYATSDGGAKTQVTCSSHGFSAGDAVTIFGSSTNDYNGTHTIEQVTTSTFVIPVAYVDNPATKGVCSNQSIVWATASDGVVVAGETIASSEIGSYLQLRCFVDNVWTVTEAFGTWAEETND